MHFSTLFVNARANQVFQQEIDCWSAGGMLYEVDPNQGCIIWDGVHAVVDNTKFASLLFESI